MKTKKYFLILILFIANACVVLKMTRSPELEDPPKFIIADVEKKILYRDYKNVIEFYSSSKMDSLWITCDSSIIESRGVNIVNFIPFKQLGHYLEITLNGKIDDKQVILGKEKFLFRNIPTPDLLLGRNRINGNFNELNDEEAFSSNRLFLILNPMVIVNASNKIEQVQITIGEHQHLIRGAFISDRIIDAFWEAEKGTKVIFDFYVYTGDGGHLHEKVNLNIVYTKKSDSKPKQ